jgi:DMSO/TMAO reductase YedYZ molybdopterin-dependent catalytic subunit
MILTNVGLRQAAGIPLPVELANDRVIPLLSISQFSTVAKLLGGLESGRISAVAGTLLLQIALGIAGGFVYAVLERRRRLSAASSWFRRIGPEPGLGLVLFAVWVAMVSLLWPALASNYRGFPPEPARALAVMGLLASLGIYGAFTVVASRLLPSSLWGPNASVPASRDQGSEMPRRALLMGGVAVLLAAASGELLRRLYWRATVGPAGYDGLRLRGPMTAPITPNDRFYVVTKNIIDPEVDADLWRLEVVGRVERPTTYAFGDLSAFSPVAQETTLECISNSVGGGLMSNAEWRGVRLAAILEEARPIPGYATVMLHAADGYTHAIAPEKALEPTTLLVYEMNGEPLPRRHGYPARIIAPGAYGEVNVKWVDRIELLDRPAEGYYERQGWMPTFVETTSRFDHPRTGQAWSLAASPSVPLRGVAFAGDRGISRVEVSTDAGRTWTEARIGYHPSPLTWALWTAEWRPEGTGTFDLVVRATDGAGTVQTPKERPISPAGATGYHRISITVRP